MFGSETKSGSALFAYRTPFFLCTTVSRNWIYSSCMLEIFFFILKNSLRKLVLSRNTPVIPQSTCRSVILVWIIPRLHWHLVLTFGIIICLFWFFFNTHVYVISDIPTELIASFSATLEDALQADLILHVRKVTRLTLQQFLIRIRIGSGFNQVSRSGFWIPIRIQEGKNDRQKLKKG